MNGRFRSGQDIMTLRDAMDRLFDDSFNRLAQQGQSPETRQYVPLADAWENEDAVTIQMALPGVDPQNVDITYEQDTLTISGEFTQVDTQKNWILRELPRGSFRRRFTLQVPIDANKVEANYQNGLLVLQLPKSEAVKPRKIQVKSS